MLRPDVWRSHLRLGEQMRAPRIIPEDLVEVHGTKVTIQFKKLGADGNSVRALYRTYLDARAAAKEQDIDLARRHFDLAAGFSATDLYAVVERRLQEIASLIR